MKFNLSIQLDNNSQFIHCTLYLIEAGSVVMMMFWCTHYCDCHFHISNRLINHLSSKHWKQTKWELPVNPKIIIKSEECQFDPFINKLSGGPCERLATAAMDIRLGPEMWQQTDETAEIHINSRI